MSMNRVMLLGNLGANPELIESKNGTQICLLSLATDQPVRTSNGSTEKRTDWHKIICFGATAESCSRYLEIGEEVLVEGRLETRKSKVDDGSSRITCRVVASSVHFLGGRSNGKEERSSEKTKQ